jgi:TPR repeat protein
MAAEAGYWEAQSWYGRFLYQTKIDRPKGRTMIQLAANQGNQRALHAIALIHFNFYKENINGNAEKKELALNRIKRAIDILKNLVDNDCDDALITYGLFLIVGIDDVLPRDYPRACQYWRRADKIGHKHIKIIAKKYLEMARDKDLKHLD